MLTVHFAGPLRDVLLRPTLPLMGLTALPAAASSSISSAPVSALVRPPDGSNLTLTSGSTGPRDVDCRDARARLQG